MESNYIAAKKGGRVWNGAQRDSGKIFHLIEKGNWYSPAICGSKVGRTSYGWVEKEEEDEDEWKVSCQKCIKKINS